MITWRGWGMIVLAICGLSVSMTAPFWLPDTETPEASITGNFVWPLLLSAALTFLVAKLLGRKRAEWQDDFMSITVKKWSYVFVVLAAVVGILGALGY